MRKISRGARCWCAIAIWAFGLLLFSGLAWWNITAFRADAENRLISESGRVAAQLAGLLSHPVGRMDEATARAIVSAAMEDERVYAVKIDTRDAMLAGLRRNYMWEPMAWDDEIAENCVQGMNPVRLGGRVEGKVNVWLSPRLNAEEESLLLDRESFRFGIFALLWTASLCLLLWYWGDFRHFARLWAKEAEEKEGGDDAEDLVLGLAHAQTQAPDQQCEKESAESPWVDAEAGRAYQRRHSDAWLVTAGLFRQTFARAPQLLTRLYADNEIAGLCHLGRVLELAAPCVGAEPLRQAAKKMQASLNDPLCAARAAPVEECAKILEETLQTLSCPKKA